MMNYVTGWGYIIDAPEIKRQCRLRNCEVYDFNDFLENNTPKEFDVVKFHGPVDQINFFLRANAKLIKNPLVGEPDKLDMTLIEKFMDMENIRPTQSHPSEVWPSDSQMKGLLD